MTMKHEPGELAVDALLVREYEVAAPDDRRHLPAVRGHVRRDAVRGWLVGLRAGRHTGWWGPVPGDAARCVRRLFEAAFPELPAVVDVVSFAHRLRRATRHAHSGIYAVAGGALELALWDLAGQRTDLPVYALLGAGTAQDVPAYATCFGVDPHGAPGRSVMTAVADSYHVQKWNHALTEALPDQTAVRFVEQLGAGRLALDFHGAWHASRVEQTCADYAQALAWVEEPCHPEEVHLAAPGQFGAPHAAGEHCYGAADTVLLERGAVDIWQPDAVFCGGMTNLLEIIRLAACAGAACMPHGGGLLPALHAAAAGAPVTQVENHLLLEPRRLAHLADPPATNRTDGLIEVPKRPGWSGPLRKELVDA